MKPSQRLKNYPYYKSIKGELVYQLYKAMAKDERIWIVTGDLGYKMFDPHEEDFPERFVDCGASEQAMLGVACGLALEGKRPFVYSITNFLIYRPFEWIRNYVDHEKLPVTLLGGGLGCDYEEDGFTHQCEDLDKVLNIFKNIHQLYSKKISDIEPMMKIILDEERPVFMGIPR